MKRTTLLPLLLALAACLPPAEDAGEVDPTESGTAGDEATSTPAGDDSSGTAGTPADAEIEATIEVEPGFFIARMIRSQGGVAVALQSAAADGTWKVQEYSPDLELLWSQTLTNAGIADLEDLGGGEFLAVGSIGSPDFVPGAWRVSCCSEVSSQEYPIEGSDQAFAIGIEPREGGFLLVIQTSTFEQSLLQIPPELAPATEVGTIPAQVVYDAASTPAGTVLVRADAGDFNMYFEVEADGVHGGDGLEGLTTMVGRGETLTLMAFGEDEVEILPFGGGDEWLTVPIPGFTAAYDTFALDRYERMVIVQGEGYEDPSPLELVEFGDDGIVVRTRTIQPMVYEYISPSLAAVGEDQAIYLVTDEHSMDGSSVEHLHRIAPL